jgi:hypothetical protein
MNREDIVYNKIMHSISEIKQDKPVKQQVSDWLIFLNYVFEQMLYKNNKFALIAVIAIGLSLNQINLTTQTETVTDDDAMYTIVYQTQADEQTTENI